MGRYRKPKMSLTSARVSCKCGKVVLKFFNPQPRICLECGCCDCRQALQWAEEQGGPKGCVVMVMTQGCNLEALPKNPQFRCQMLDFPENCLSELHLFKGQKQEDISQDFYPEGFDWNVIKDDFEKEVGKRQGISQQDLMEEFGPVQCLDLLEEEISRNRKRE